METVGEYVYKEMGKGGGILKGVVIVVYQYHQQYFAKVSAKAFNLTYASVWYIVCTSV